MVSRRRFCSLSAAAFSLPLVASASEGGAIPLKFGHRQANMVEQTGPIVFEIARRIRGLSGVELQMIWKGQDLSDHETTLAYKREANRWAVQVPSIAGIWSHGESIFNIGSARQTIQRAIRAAELLGASVILVALFDANCPNMSDESSYGPVVDLLQNVSSEAADAGVALGLETSLTPADDKKFVDLVNRSAVRIYYDATNKELAYPGQSVPGIQLLGQRIVQIHLKNEDRLLSEPAKVNWPAALRALQRISYQGWYVFETKHQNPEQCVLATQQNIDFVRTYSA
ncbi:MAG: sugar phosphate isomerase/epimerase [Acidobacteriaceae bacterium]|nr:sugar phosphate isomerase/epimerase [Acidobacteriaceae bacterium]